MKDNEAKYFLLLNQQTKTELNDVKYGSCLCHRLSLCI